MVGAKPRVITDVGSDEGKIRYDQPRGAWRLIVKQVGQPSSVLEATRSDQVQE